MTIDFCSSKTKQRERISGPINLSFSRGFKVGEWSLQSISIFHFLKQSTFLSSSTYMIGFGCSLQSALLTFNPLLPSCSWIYSLTTSTNWEKTTANSKVMQRQQIIKKSPLSPLYHCYYYTVNEV